MISIPKTGAYGFILGKSEFSFILNLLVSSFQAIVICSDDVSCHQ